MIRVVEITRMRFFPVFYNMEDPIVQGRSAEKTRFLDGRGESCGWKLLVEEGRTGMEGMGLVGDQGGHVS